MRRSSSRSNRRVDRGGRARPDFDDGAFRAGCRTFIEAGQRLDFVSDLAEDLREGRLGVPMETLKRFSVTVEDLAAGRESAGVRELVGDQVRAARAGLRPPRRAATAGASRVSDRGPGGPRRGGRPSPPPSPAVPRPGRRTRVTVCGPGRSPGRGPGP
ncbi:squalene/phytoene synthase family protein [Streptomyces sp. HM190]|uniref:squalene/phytoene synthase family protein n=1 Tax=Streptomyces sp. HM190 TaxID=2695266 RepID=UPI001356ADF8|nr:squalene/phytoene synthase family protein [Streptomyces sp. HM190]